MTEQSLWGDFGAFEAIRTPSIILREQAEFVARITDQILLGDVRQHSYEGRFTVELSIIAPAIQRYRYKVLESSHGIELYPTEITDYVNDKRFSALDEEKLLGILRQVLSSGRMKETFAVLISESRGRDQEDISVI